MKEIPENQLDQRLQTLAALRPPEGAEEQAMDRVRQTLCRQRDCEIKNPYPEKRRSTMARQIGRYAAIAALVAVVFSVWQYVQSPGPGSGVVWAQVARNMEQVRSFQYREQRTASSPMDKTGHEIHSSRETRVYWLSEYGSRRDVYQDGDLSLSIFNLIPTREYAVIYYRQKEYGRQNVKWAPACTDYDDVAYYIQMIRKQEYVKLGRQKINGVEAEGIELKGQMISGETVDNAVTRVWVDVQSELPVFVELIGSVHKGTDPIRIVQDQFVWNAPLEESFLQPNIPADYAMVDLGIDEKPKATKSAAPIPFVARKTPDFSYLQELGLLNEDKKPQGSLKLSGMEEIWKEQDRIMKMWPAYEEVREALQRELASKITLADWTTDELVHLGFLLREKFWDAGGCLSTTSYRYGYMARIVLEAAHEQVPDELAITDELVEAIQSVMMSSIYPEHSNQRVRNPKFVDALFDLRKTQFEQLTREVLQGRAPTWEDFARGYDFSLLLARREEYEQARQVAQWLLDHADAGGWSAYRKTLEELRTHLAEQSSLYFNLYCTKGTTFPEEYLYGLRLPSFKGPVKRGLVPSLESPDPK